MAALNSNNLENAQNIVNSLNRNNVKFIRKDSGLIERKNNNEEKVILTEDNRQVLFG